MAHEGAIASLSVRTVGTWICPVDGWLTLSAGFAAVGPGVALAAADSMGGLDAYAPMPERFRGWGRYRVTIVDLENVVRPYLGAEVSPPRVLASGAVVTAVWRTAPAPASGPFAPAAAARSREMSDRARSNVAGPSPG